MRNFIFEIVRDRIVRDNIDPDRPVLDPCVDAGSLLKHFRKNGFQVIGIDIENQGFPRTRVRNYLSVKPGEIKMPGLVIMNPLSNLDRKTKKIYPRALERASVASQTPDDTGVFTGSSCRAAACFSTTGQPVQCLLTEAQLTGKAFAIGS